MKKQSGTLAALISFSAIFVGGNAFAFKIVSFDGKFTRWPDNNVHYVLDTRGSHDFDGDAVHGCDKAGACKTVQQVIQESFQSWTQVPGVNINFQEDAPETVSKTGYDKKNTIIWIEKNWKEQSFSPPAEALAVTISTYKTSGNEIVDSDIHFNGEYFKWADINDPSEENSDAVDIQNIATHEIGHFFGLDHSSEDIFEPVSKLYLATMFFASGPGEVFRRHLGDDDKSASVNLYPDHEESEPSVAEIVPNTIDNSMTRTAAVQIRGNSFSSVATAMIAVSGDHGDVVAQQVTSSPDELNVVFDVSRLPAGTYDVVVANAHNKLERVEKGITIVGGSAFPDDSIDSGGLASSGSGGCRMKGQRGMSGVLLMIFPLLLLGASRASLAYKKRQKVYAARQKEGGTT